MSSPVPALPTVDQPAAVGRRVVLGGGLAIAGAGGLTLLGSVAPVVAAPLRDPFTLGVASGDPLPDRVVIWTRLAPQPLAADGRGGMPNHPYLVRWEVAEDERFRRVVRRGRALARPDFGHSVHVDVEGLRPAREYWYRFRVGSNVSRTGRTRTAPARRARVGELMIGAVSCSQYEHGFFTAYRRLAEENPDLVLHLGDYQYEYKAKDYLAPGGNVRDHEGPETVDLAGYRQRHAQYKTDADLQELHAVAPWAVIFDDHEVDNNWADEIPENVSETAGFRARRAAAFRAYYENMPLRRSSIPRGPDIQIYRRLGWGALADIHLLDTRQYRDDQACGDTVAVGCTEALDPARSLCGERQERWLLDGLADSRAEWQLISQQVFFSRRDFAAGPDVGLSMDGWDGYAANRQRLVDGIVERDVDNAVVLTGDVHRHYASQVLQDFDDPGSRPVAAELVATSITSGGDGSDTSAATDLQLRENPWIKFANSQRGYVTATVTPRELTARFHVLPYVKRPGAPSSVRATFVVESGDPTLNPVVA